MPALAAACAGYNPAPTVRRGGTLHVAIRQDAQSLNPLVAGDLWSVRALTPLFPNLYQAGPDLTVTPDLAAALPAISPDGLTWKVTLRHAQWSDQRPITAADVVYTVQTEMNPGLDTTARFGWSDVASVAAEGERTVEFHLKHRDASFLGDALVAAVVPSHALTDVSASAMSSALFSTQPMVAGGPFQLELRQPGENIFLKANKHYYGPQPYLDGVQLQVLSDPTLLADGFGQGTLDWALDISAAEARALAGVPNVTVRRFGELGRYALLFNERTGRPFATTAARQAVAAALDRRRIARAAGGTPVWSGINPSSWAAGLAFSARAAGSATPAAGELLYPLGDAARSRAAAEIAREAPSLTPTAVPPGEFEARLRAGDFDSALAGLGEGVDPDPAAAVETGGGQNFGAYSDPAVDSLVEQDLALDPSDHAARRPVLDRLQRQLWADPPFVDLWTVEEVDAFSGNLVGAGRAGPQLDQDLQSAFYARWSLAA